MILSRVLLPRRIRGFDDGLPQFQAYDVQLEGEHVADIRPVDGDPEGILLPAFVDVHAHLDKTYTVEEVGAVQGDLFAAIERMKQHQERWTGPEIQERMTRALAEAWRSGTRAIRTHLDWPDARTPAALPVFQRLRERWAQRVELQFVALTPLDVYEDPVAGAAIAAAVAQAGGVLGAFIYRNQHLDQKLVRFFQLANQHGLSVDFHVDEGLHRDAVGLRWIAELGPRLGFGGGRITCSHCCSLSVQPPQVAAETLAVAARAGLHLVGLPTTNLYLQGAWDGTPVERGITRLREAADAGIRGCIATDNVADGFYPYGSYDLLETFSLGVQLAHLAPAIGWVDAITTNPARAMGLAWDGRIAPGCPADLVLLAARGEYELLTPAGRRRTVIRRGEPQ
jgi:cytosine/creatinine deaminase